MEKHQHLKLPLVIGNVNRKIHTGGAPPALPKGRNKAFFSQNAIQESKKISQKFATFKKQLSEKIDPTLIFEIKINQGIFPDAFDKILSSMDIHVLSVAEDKKGYWVVFSEDEELEKFKQKLEIYGSKEGAKYDFFNAIESFNDIPEENKIGQSLIDQPLENSPEFIDIELWNMNDPQKNTTFISQLKDSYNNYPEFRVSDTLITKSFVLLRVKLTKPIFDQIIKLKEVSRVDRPIEIQFNPFEMTHPDIQDIDFYSPDENAVGILVIDSGIISNHPMLEKCVGGEENFQSGEPEIHDTVGHGTSVAGTAVYGDIAEALTKKEFNPSNWLFSAKVMYAEKNQFNGSINAQYDPEKLIEHQFKDAVESFISNPEYHIKVVNISLGNSNEIWHKHYTRQLPLAALIDELAYTFPHVVFIVSAGNNSPLNDFETIADVVENYPNYLTENKNFKIINPATSALALTIGSIVGEIKIEEERFPKGAENIKTAIAQQFQPSPFTRTGMGINGMIKPELVEYGGNMILSESYGRVIEDKGGKLAVLNNQVTDNVIKFDTGTSFSAPKVAHLAGQIANQFPDKSANFIKNMLLVGADDVYVPDDHFYGSLPEIIGIKAYEGKIFNKINSDYDRNTLINTYQKSDKGYVLNSIITDQARRDTAKIFHTIKYNTGLGEKDHLSVCGYGLSRLDKATHSFDNRAVLWDEGQLSLNKIKVYSLQLPESFFTEKGKKKIIVTLTFTPETRASRGDSYLGNRMSFHMFHSINPEILIENYGSITNQNEKISVPDNLKKCEIVFSPGTNVRKAGCHQKAWKVYKREPIKRPKTPISLVLLNFNKWISDVEKKQDYCISVTFEHEKEINIYNEIRVGIQPRTRVR